MALALGVEPPMQTPSPSPRRRRARRGRRRSPVPPTAGILPLEARVLPAAISLAGGALTVAASAGESNDLSVEVERAGSETWLVVTETGPGVPLTVAGSGLVTRGPGVVAAPLSAVSSLAVATGAEGDSGGEADAVALRLDPSLPTSLSVTGATGDDRITLLGTGQADTLDLQRLRNAEGFKVVRASFAGQSLSFLDFEHLGIDVSQDGADTVRLDRYIAGLGRPLEVELIGGGAGVDALQVVGEGDVPQAVEVTDGVLRIYDDPRDARDEVFLGRSDNVAIQQPLVTVEVIDEARPPGDQSLGPFFLNQLLLDTGATGLLIVDFAASELEENGIVDDGDYLEQGVSGFTPMDVSAPYRFDYAGRSGVRNTIPDARLLYSSSVSFSFLGPFGIIGMPTMVDKVVELDMSGWSEPLEAEDLSIGVEFSGALPHGLEHPRSVPLRLVDFPHDGRVGDDPLPTFAPLPFLTVEARDDGHAATGEFLLDTGAQLSLISTDLAIELGLDKNGNGTLDDEALDFIEVGGIGGTSSIPLVAVDQAAVATEDGAELVWTELLVGVLDIEVEDGPRIDGVFGMDFLTSGWAAKVLPPLLGLPGSDRDGYFSQVYFDFRDSADGVGTMILNLTPEFDEVVEPPTLPLTITHSGLESLSVATGPGDDRFAVAPSTAVLISLDGGGPDDDDELRLIPDGLPATDDGSTILVPGYLPISHSRFERVDLEPGASRLIDDGFEAPEAGPPGVFGSFIEGPPGTPWSFTGDSGVAADGSGFTAGNPTAPEGDQVAFLQRVGRFSQPVEVAESGVYRLSFRAAQRANSRGGVGHDFAVTVDGVRVALIEPAGTSYQPVELLLRLEAGTHAIGFEGINRLGGDRTSLIDAVSLARAVPGTLLGGGFEAPEAGPEDVFNSFIYRPAGTPWSFTGDSGVAADGSGFTAGNPTAPEGDQVAFLQRVGRFSQPVEVAESGVYRLSFRAAARVNSRLGPGHDFAVTVDGVEVARVEPGGASYQEVELLLSLDAGIHTIGFVGINRLGGDRTSLIDAVRLEFDSPSGGGDGFLGDGPASTPRGGLAAPLGLDRRWGEFLLDRARGGLLTLPGGSPTPTPTSPNGPWAGAGAGPTLPSRPAARVPHRESIDAASADRPALRAEGRDGPRPAPPAPDPTAPISRRTPNQVGDSRTRAPISSLDGRAEAADPRGLAERLRLTRR
ncbi:retropepsin-like aspartic protease [Tautonia plasticadhaerens]|uniref:retropepsin-like aspartic protease n=1 Tax=Tautonia plasticadhaerens TaxID=2527974 RepID=UPI0011A4A505|nr:retropepsin-like aspartic protease [Tautonia plasticadhaerens]